MLSLLSLPVTPAATVTSTLTFTNANWDTPQTVTVTGADDDLIDGTIIHNHCSINDGSSDDDFDGVADQTVTQQPATTTPQDSPSLKQAEQQLSPNPEPPTPSPSS